MPEVKSPDTQSSPDIQPLPGYVLTKQFVPVGVFKNIKEGEGDQFSEVIAISESVVDDKGTIRFCPVAVGDIIIHAQTNKDFEISFTKYRNVHYTEIHNVWKDAKLKWSELK